jgi:N-carbamoyl-L-amino-acid hydrolase
MCPAGMVFIPCWKGISHNEAESAEPGDVAAGAQVIADVLVEMANM